ncbi:5'/3'-nucleotidase SurE [Halocalculus aciditolerans]|uniref:5'-nucleotidase SurE n=1 Tax=Halocalculus aciditolerans TaxID=1383812 RepID=A0A830F9L4_9EURY|nr:5'/3'-nucleotidase SurE [Halocalculus aciditolerans]GGL53256.1 5'/3'-nucleotidase SurE [Halocalculus aciditolerans]
MTTSRSVLLTNDDGIDAPGLQAVYDRLSETHDVTVVAPAENQSGTGQTRSWGHVDYDERHRGYAVQGTPADCVAIAIGALDVEPDIVVSGCNDGPNLGAHVLARSGTIGAAMEASFLGYPAIAVSMYDWAYTPGEPYHPEQPDFVEAAAAVDDLLPGFLDGDVLPTADYLTINAPAAGQADTPVYRVTRPTQEYELQAEFTEAGVNVNDRFWTDLFDRDVPDPEGTDRRAVVDNETSISPLVAPHSIATGATAGGIIDV